MKRRTIRAITIDLDDTLWPVGPTIAAAEGALRAWLETHAPAVAADWPPARMRALRDELMSVIDPALRHDMGHMRRASIARALELCGDDPAKAETAYAEFDRARQAVEFFPDALPALARLAERFPIFALSNGTADIRRIGIDHHFAGALAARDLGVSKPDPRLFHAACERLGVAPNEVVHVGDDAALDVEGALGAGMVAVWVNRAGAAWPGAGAPHHTVGHLGELVDWLEAAD